MLINVGIFLVALVCYAKAETENALLDEFLQGNYKLTASLYRELLKINDGNFLVSPFSLETVLAMTQAGAQGDTAEEIRRGLQLPDSPAKIEQFYRDILPKIKGNEQYSLNTANKIYVKDGFKLNDTFRSIAEKTFLAGVENIDFGQKDEAAGTINKWVEQQTNKKIEKLIDPTGLNEATRLILVNALYFNGKWANRFDTQSTNKEKFYKSQSESQEVDMMHQTDTFKYRECNYLNAKFLELPYQGGDISMVIVLPKEKFGLAAIENKIESVFEIQNFTYQNVYVALPQFTIGSKIKFVPILQNLGIKKPFTEAADLTGIAAGKESLFISDVVQKTYINVTETGTEAAAATAVEVAFESLPEPPDYKFEANQPFLFYLKNSSIILFAGRVTGF